MMKKIKKTRVDLIVKFLRHFAKMSKPDNFDDGFMLQHVLFSANVISDKIIPKDVKGRRENGFFFLDEDNFEQVVDIFIDKVLGNAKDVAQVYIHIRKADRLQFFELTKELMDEKDYGQILHDIWSDTEFPHQLSNDLLIQLFNEAKPEYLMYEDIDDWNKLKDTLIVYRGIQKLCGKEAKQRGLSWTLSPKVARWFAKRWKNDGAVLRAEIDKKDCFAYNNGRNEFEIILNPKKLRKIVQIDGKIESIPAVDIGMYKESDINAD